MADALDSKSSTQKVCGFDSLLGHFFPDPRVLPLNIRHPTLNQALAPRLKRPKSAPPAVGPLPVVPSGTIVNHSPIVH